MSSATMRSTRSWDAIGVVAASMLFSAVLVGQPASTDERWQPLTYPGTVFSGTIKAMAEWKPAGRDSLLVISAERFQRPSAMVGAKLGFWDGSNWSTPPVWTNQQIVELFDWNGLLVAAATVDPALTGPPWNNVATYDGTTWRTLGEGLNGIAREMTVYRGQLVVGGKFTLDDETCLVARWDGVRWHNMTAGATSTNGDVYALLARGDDLYIGGEFLLISGNLLTNAARWTSTHWRALPPGLTGRVVDLAYWNNALYVAGELELPWPVNLAVGLARLPDANINAWQPILPERRGVNAMLPLGNSLYIYRRPIFPQLMCDYYNGRWNCRNDPPSTILGSVDRLDVGGTTAIPFAANFTSSGQNDYITTYREWPLILYDSITPARIVNGFVSSIGDEDRAGPSANWYPAFLDAGVLDPSQTPVEWAAQLTPFSCRAGVSGQPSVSNVTEYRGDVLTIDCGDNRDLLEFDTNRFVQGRFHDTPVFGKFHRSDGRLFFSSGGRDSWSGTRWIWLQEWDGNAWQRIGNSFWSPGGQPAVNSPGNVEHTVLQVFGGRIYLLGYFAFSPLWTGYRAAYWDGSSWTPFESPPGNLIADSIVWRGRFLVLTKSGTPQSGEFLHVMDLTGERFTQIAAIPISGTGPISLFPMESRLGIVARGSMYAFDGQTITPWSDLAGLTSARFERASYTRGWLIADGEFDLGSDQVPAGGQMRAAQVVLDCRMMATSGDANCDGMVDAQDIRAFVTQILDPARYDVEWPHCDWVGADMNHDGVLNEADVPGFVAAYLNGGG